jgi:hypothetical protein
MNNKPNKSAVAVLHETAMQVNERSQQTLRIGRMGIIIHSENYNDLGTIRRGTFGHSTLEKENHFSCKNLIRKFAAKRAFPG